MTISIIELYAKLDRLNRASGSLISGCELSAVAPLADRILLFFRLPMVGAKRKFRTRHHEVSGQTWNTKAHGFLPFGTLL
jgi:hypothetical protein